MKHIEESKKSSNQWRKKNPHYQKEWAKQNPGKVKAYQKRYYVKNTAKRHENVKQWRRKNPGTVQKYYLTYRRENKERINRLWRSRYNVRYRNDTNFKLSKNLRNRVAKLLFGKNKSLSTLKILGVKSAEQVRAHIEKQFKVGMT